jgi:hypothetical protein
MCGHPTWLRTTSLPKPVPPSRAVPVSDAPETPPTLLLERLLVVVDEGRRTGTHKLLTLLALMDAAAASVGEDLRPARELSVRSVAEHVLDVAWPHVVPFAIERDAIHLRQMNDQRRDNELVQASKEARHRADAIGARTSRQLRQADATIHEAAISRIERQLVRYPLALLQRTDADAPDFLYHSWPHERTPTAVARLQGRDEPTIVWLPGAPEALLRFSALLRPLIELAFVRDVARWNDLDTAESRLHAHLFGAARNALAAEVKEELLDVQDRRCFYDPEGQRQRPEDLQVDHFLPWARFHADGVANLVLARASHNASKSDLFAATRHVQAWRDSLLERTAVARRVGLDHETPRTLAMARAGYGHLPDDSPMWLRRVPSGPGREVERLTAERRVEIAQLLRHDTYDLAAEDPGAWSSE